MLKDNEALEDNAATLPYIAIRDLIYNRDIEKGLRLCVPTTLYKEVSALAHDEMGHPGYS